MRILLLCHSFNSLSQRIFVSLKEDGHEVVVEYDINDQVTTEAVEAFRPDVLIAPFLKRAIPEAIWRNNLCLIVHPGPKGDRGPSSLDWAILENQTQWGVTVLQAESEMDAGPVWASAEFTLPANASKGAIYRKEVANAAVLAVKEAIKRIEAQEKPEIQDYNRPDYWGKTRPLMNKATRSINWDQDDSATIIRKIQASEGMPGARAILQGREFSLHNAKLALDLKGKPGEIVAFSGDYLGIATKDGGIWVGHLKDHLKLPACQVIPPLDMPELPGPQDIIYKEEEKTGHLYFNFHNGAMSTSQCQALLQAFKEAQARPTETIILWGGEEFWSNGINLNVIEEAPSPADESWANINAMDDLTRAIIECVSHKTIAVMRGNAGAGGVFLALAADYVIAADHVVLNPHYKGMGNLYGSEYWTYLLPQRAGEANAAKVTEARLPLGVKEAQRLGLLDFFFPFEKLESEVKKIALQPFNLAAKKAQREKDEALKPLSQYRAEELAKMKLNFYGFDPSYHVARYNFVFKVPKSRTPYYLAQHRIG